MRKAKCHHHFFWDYSLLSTAKYLAFFSLKLPYEFNNREYLDQNLSPEQAQTIMRLYEKLVSERLPVEYLTHEAHYLGRTFYVNEHVLVPRSLMNTRFEDFLKDIVWKNQRVLDLCTGSGCIGITLALLNTQIDVDLADISQEALNVAEINIDRYHLRERVERIQSDLFSNINRKYDLIISNPPYVTVKEHQHSPLEFKQEPVLALIGGQDGLDLIHRILQQAKHYLNPQGTLIAEVGFSAAKRLKKYYPRLPFQWFTYRRPSGKKSFFDPQGVFRIKAQDLPGQEGEPR